MKEIPPVEISVGPCARAAGRCLQYGSVRVCVQRRSVACVRALSTASRLHVMGSEPFTRGNRFLFALGQRHQVERMIINF